MEIETKAGHLSVLCDFTWQTLFSRWGLSRQENDLDRKT